MPANKRQHYVPKHILKRFASDKNNKQVNLVHIPSMKIVRGASLREQCYSDYFYGKNLAVEKSLSVIEGVQAQLIDKIVLSYRLNATDTADVALLLSLQKARTLGAEASNSGMIEALMKLAMFGRVEEQDLRMLRIELTHGPNLSVLTALKTSPLLYDLEQTLIVNKSDIPFIISDCPVILTNWFCRIKYPHKGGTGISTAGLQMLMPITPTLAILLTDAGIYKVNAPDGKLTLTERSEVQRLNELQWLNAHHTIYFPPAYLQTRLDDLMFLKGRRSKNFEFQRLERNEDSKLYCRTRKDEYAPPAEGVSSEIVQMGTPPLPRDIRLSAIKMRQRKRFYDDGTMASPLRDPVWLKIVMDYNAAIESKAISSDSFPTFVANHPLEPAIGPWQLKAAKRALRQEVSASREPD